MEEERILEMVRACYEDGIMPTDIDPGVTEVNGREVKFTLNTSVDEVKVKWLKARTVTIIFQEGARFLPRKVKEDAIRAYEDGWISDEFFGQDFKRGRIKVESPNVVSYIPRTQEITNWMLTKRSDFIELARVIYRTEFKPWITRAELKDWRKLVDQDTFWVVAVGVPLDEMVFLHVHVENAIGKILKRHLPEADDSDPKLVNLRFDIDPSKRDCMKDKIWIQTHQGDLLEVRLADADTEWCGRCRNFFHTEDTCRRPSRRTRGGSSDNHRPAFNSRAGGVRQSYQGTLHAPGGGLQQQPQAMAASSAAPAGSSAPAGVNVRSNPTFSPGGIALQQAVGNLQTSQAGASNPSMTNPGWVSFLQGLPPHPFSLQQAMGQQMGAQLGASSSFTNLHAFAHWSQGWTGAIPGQQPANMGMVTQYAPPPHSGGGLGNVPSGNRSRGESPGKQRRISERGGIEIRVDEVHAEASGSSNEASLNSGTPSSMAVSGGRAIRRRAVCKMRMNLPLGDGKIHRHNVFHLRMVGLREASTAIERISGLRPLLRAAADEAKLLVKPCKGVGKRLGEVFDLLVEMKKILDSRRQGVCPPDVACLHEIGEALESCHEVLCKLQTGSKLLMSEHAPQIVEQLKGAMDKLQASVQQINLPLLNMPSNIWDKVQNISRAKKITPSLEKQEVTAWKEMQAIRTSFKKGHRISVSERTRAEQLLRTLGLTSEEARAAESRALQLEKVRVCAQLNDISYCIKLLRTFDETKGSHWGDVPGDDVRIGSFERERSSELKSPGIGSFERERSSELKLWKIRLLRRSIHLTPETESKQNIDFLLNMLGLEEARDLAQEGRHAQAQVKVVDFLIELLRCTEVPVEQLRESLPQQFVCPLSQERMVEPVIIASHEVYERAFIYEWLHKRVKKVCPKTKNRLGDSQLLPNFTLRAEIRLWSLQNGYDVPCKLQGDSLGKLINNWVTWFIDNGEDVHKLAVLCREARVSNLRGRSRLPVLETPAHENACDFTPEPGSNSLRDVGGSPSHAHRGISVTTRDGECYKEEVDGSVDGEDDHSGSSTSGSLSGEVPPLLEDGQHNASRRRSLEKQPSGKSRHHSRSWSGDLWAGSPSAAVPPLNEPRSHLSPGRSKPTSIVTIPADTTPLYNPARLLSGGPGRGSSERLLYRGPKEGDSESSMTPSSTTPSSPHVTVETQHLPSSEILRRMRWSAPLNRYVDSPLSENSADSPAFAREEVLSPESGDLSCEKQEDSPVVQTLNGGVQYRGFSSARAQGQISHAIGSLEHIQGDQGAKLRYTEDRRHIVNGLGKLAVAEQRASGMHGSSHREREQVTCSGESRVDLAVRIPCLDSHIKGYDREKGLEHAETDATVNAIGWVGDDASDALKVSKEERSEPAINRACSVRSHDRRLTTSLSWKSQDHSDIDQACLVTVHSPETNSSGDVFVSASHPCTSASQAPNGDSLFLEGGQERVPSEAKIIYLVRKAHPSGAEVLDEELQAINTLRRLAKNVPECRVLICELGGVEMMEAIFQKVHRMQETSSVSHGMDRRWVKVLEDAVATALNVSIEAELKIRIARSEILAHLVRILEEAPTEEVREITAETFRSLSRDELHRIRDLIRERGGIPALISALQQENRTECLGSAVLKTLSALSVDPENRMQMLSAGIIPIALKIAQQPGSPMAYPAVSVIHNLMSIPAARLKVVEMRGVSVLFGVIQRNEEQPLVENALAILFCIACASEWLQSEVAKMSGLVDTLKQVISDPNSTPRAKIKATHLLKIPMLRQRSNGAELARLHAMNEGVMHER
ncbi:hypothetical protein CBR_g17890 [Chara braunii]|uniref:RING-type E3 ubiquitin transferase n=1 Tax=Chara braunii TaxID=69332 RepID=A0A388KVU0_CHABU|nr:hypothetical protein CBR_g17890 [Chara braunii]|eukprot:GBG74176.1 hypothetical protein CBR_g17890 [Chara braunii]